MTQSPFAVRGAMEAFYGTYYTVPERKDLIRFLGQNGFNFYLYGPKNDRQHRMRWWDPYPSAVMRAFESTIDVARKSSVTFCYALSFGTPLNSSSLEDFELAAGKLMSFYRRGCRSFAVLLDDLTEDFTPGANPERHRAVASAHADWGNRMHAWLRTMDEPCSFYVCPGEYWGKAPFSPYLHTLGAELDPDIGVFYTGRAVCSREITLGDVREFAEVMRRPPVIWDNYPVNDLAMRPEMHLGPLLGRDPLLASVTSGYVANLMVQGEASKIALLTQAEYLCDPTCYDADRAWKRALRAVSGASFDHLFRMAENSLRSCLQDEEAPTMDHLAGDALAALRSGEPASQSAAVAELIAYLTVVDEACYELKNRMRNLRLRGDILPWIEALEERVWMARRALMVLRAIEDGTDFHSALKTTAELLDGVRRDAKRIGGTVVVDLASFARERAEREFREPSTRSEPQTVPFPGTKRDPHPNSTTDEQCEIGYAIGNQLA